MNSFFLFWAVVALHAWIEFRLKNQKTTTKFKKVQFMLDAVAKAIEAAGEAKATGKVQCQYVDLFPDGFACKVSHQVVDTTMIKRDQDCVIGFLDLC